MSIDMADLTGNFVLSTKASDGIGHVYFFANDGELKWQLYHNRDSKIDSFIGATVKISEDGQGILINWGGDWESTHVQYYNSSGELLYSELSGHGQLETLSDDGCFFNRVAIFEPDGGIKKINWPDFIQQRPMPETYFVNCDLLAVAAIVKQDTVFSQIPPPAERTKPVPPGIRRPSRGILRIEAMTELLLMRPDGTILVREGLGINGGISGEPKH